MSKVARLGVVILFALVVVSAGVAIWTLLQKKTLEDQNQSLQQEIAKDKTKQSQLLSQAQKLQSDAQALNDKITQLQSDKSNLQGSVDDLKQKADTLQDQVAQANQESTNWKSQVDTLRHDRDALMQQLKNRPERIVYKDRVLPSRAAVNPGEDSDGSMSTAAFPPITSAHGDQFWAGVLRQRAALQLQVGNLKRKLDDEDLQVVTLKKQNSDLQLQIGQLNNEKADIEQKIKYGQDLADSLSIDLARSHNDQKAVNDQADKIKGENLDLQSQVRTLATTKLALEKTVSRLTDEKAAMQKKLVETESVIQSRIDDIWKIKNSLDQKLEQNAPPQTSSTGNGSVDLPPIIVNASGSQSQSATAPSVSMPAAATADVKSQGAIISINGANQFVITDLGQSNSPVSIGRVLKVYHGNKPVGTLEVIQVRNDISAADIKDTSAPLRVGDIVKFD